MNPTDLVVESAGSSGQQANRTPLNVPDARYVNHKITFSAFFNRKPDQKLSVVRQNSEDIFQFTVELGCQAATTLCSGAANHRYGVS